MKLLTKLFSPVSPHFLPLTPVYSPQLSNTLITKFFPEHDRPSCTPIPQHNRQPYSSVFSDPRFKYRPCSYFQLQSCEHYT